MASYDRQNMLVTIICSTTRAKPGQVASIHIFLLFGVMCSIICEMFFDVLFVVFTLL